MRFARYAFLTALLAGLVLTLALGRSSVQVSGSPTAYGPHVASGIGSDTVPPRDLFVAASSSSGLSLAVLIPVLAIVVLLTVGGVVFVRRRGGGGGA